MDQDEKYGNKPCFYQKIKKTENTLPGLVGYMNHLVMFRYLAIAGIFLLAYVGSYLTINYMKNKGFDMSYIRLLTYIQFPVLLLLTLIAAYYAIKELRIINNEETFQRSIHRLDWFVGETKNYLLLLNMDFFFIKDKNERQLDQYLVELKENAKELSGILQDVRESIPADAPILAMEKERLNTIKKREIRKLFQLAITEICMEQLEKGNEDFFVKEDFWEYYI